MVSHRLFAVSIPSPVLVCLGFYFKGRMAMSFTLVRQVCAWLKKALLPNCPFLVGDFRLTVEETKKIAILHEGDK